MAIKSAPDEQFPAGSGDRRVVGASGDSRDGVSIERQCGDRDRGEDHDLIATSTFSGSCFTRPQVQTSSLSFSTAKEWFIPQPISLHFLFKRRGDGARES